MLSGDPTPPAEPTSYERPASSAPATLTRVAALADTQVAHHQPPVTQRSGDSLAAYFDRLSRALRLVVPASEAQRPPEATDAPATPSPVHEGEVACGCGDLAERVTQRVMKQLVPAVSEAVRRIVEEELGKAEGDR